MRAPASAVHEGFVEQNHEPSTSFRTAPRSVVKCGRLLDDREVGDLVFEARSGGHLPLGEFRWAFDKAAAAVGIEGLVPHGLRHTAASLAISAGANIKVVQKMLGHKTATLTLDLYGHLFPDDLDAVAAVMNAGGLAAADDLRTMRESKAKGQDGQGDLPAVS